MSFQRLKKRKYFDEYVNFNFLRTEGNDEEIHMCYLCDLPTNAKSYKI